MLNSIDLFCGAGGLTHGLKLAGFNCLFANEFDKDAMKSFSLNHTNAFVSTEDVQKIEPESIKAQLKVKKGALDLVAGGPPCQGFSTYGKRDLGDDRNYLYNHFLKFVSEFMPKAVLVENVQGILSFNDGKIIEDITKKLKQLGYKPNVVLLDAVNFGVPQYRKRVFILAGNNFFIKEPMQTHTDQMQTQSSNQLSLLSTSSSKLLKAITVRDAIADLPEVALAPKQNTTSIPYNGKKISSDYQLKMRNGTNALTYHSAKQMLTIRKIRLSLMDQGDYGEVITNKFFEDSAKIENIISLAKCAAYKRDLDQCRTVDREKEEELQSILTSDPIDISLLANYLNAGGFKNKYRRLNWDEPSHTLVAHMARDCSDFVHPEYNRFISVREAARLQSFDDKYIFTGSQFQQFKQIGNAVPPLLAQALGASIKHALD